MFYAKLYMLKKLHRARTYRTNSITAVKKSVAQVFFCIPVHVKKTTQDKNFTGLTV